MLLSVVFDHLLVSQPVVKSWSKPIIEADTPKPGKFLSRCILTLVL